VKTPPKINRRGWLALWLQDRRRARKHAATTPNAPVITNGGFEWDATEPGFADVWVDWTFVHGSFPAATIEVWVSVNGDAYYQMDTVASDVNSYYYPRASSGESSFAFKVRYRNGTTVGPFSNVYQINIEV
jgi:hypothetical protein